MTILGNLKCLGRIKFTSRTNFFADILNRTYSDSKTHNLATALSKTWSQKQAPRELALKGARFETVNIEKQPSPEPAIELISKSPIIEVKNNHVTCKGAEKGLGHPQIFINLVHTNMNMAIFI